MSDAYEEDGRPVKVKLRVTLLRVVDPAHPTDKGIADSIKKQGHRWIAARLRFVSLGPDTFHQATGDIELVDASGQRYKPEGVNVVEPGLGEGAVLLSQGDKASGYLSFQVPKAATIDELRMPMPLSGEIARWRL